MTELPIFRPLSASELSFTTGYGLYVSYGVETSGGLDLRGLQGAVDTLAHRHPVLSAAIVDVDGVRIFVDTGATPRVKVRDADEADDVLEGLSIRQDLGVAGVFVQRYSDGREVVNFLAHHGVADGHHGLSLLAELWQLYAAPAASTELSNVESFPVSVETFLGGYGITVDGPPSLHLDDNDEDEGPGQLPPATFPMIRVDLSEDATAALIANGRARGRTVNETLSAALMKSTATATGVNLPDLSYFYAVDVRRRVDPDVDFTSVTNALGFTGFRTEEAEIDSFVLAGHIGAGLKAGLATGDVQASPLDPVPVFEGRTDPAVIQTNWGVVPPIERPAGLLVHDFHARFHMEFGPDGLAPLAEAGIPMAEIKQKLRPVVAMSFEGRLIVNFVVNSPLAAEIARALPAELESML